MSKVYSIVTGDDKILTQGIPTLEEAERLLLYFLNNYEDAYIGDDEYSIKPQLFSKWSHTNGNIYTVIGYANEATENPDKYPVTVIYKGANNNTWCRPLSDWYRSFTQVE